MTFGPPDWPSAANLTPHEAGLKGWTFEEFEKAMTTGVSKDGHALRDPMTLIIPQAKRMTDVERRALWKYLTSLPATTTNG